MDNTKQPSFTSISIGPGIRGIERGIERVLGKFRELALVEIEAFIIENLVCQMEQGFLDASVIWTNAKTFPEVAHIFRGLVDFLFAGYPCQPFSAAGKRKGSEDPRHLYPFIERTIDIVRPRAIFFENVRGHVTLGLREVVASLEGMGYRVHWGIFSAEETGASHKRERVFILGIRKDWMEDTSDNGFKRWFKGGIDSISTEGTSQLGHSSELHVQRCTSRPWQIQPWRTSDEPTIELADTDNNGERAQSREAEGEGKEIEGTEQRQERNEVLRERMRPESGNGSEQLANNLCSRFPKWEKQPAWQELKTIKRGNTVARPAQVQHGWERPRTISYAEETTEPSLGLSAHGYRFREDVLRALGNSVYENTAELAFLTLVKKFCHDP